MSFDVITAMSAGPFAAACLLLGVAGAAKVRAPVRTGLAAAALGLPGSRAAVRTFGAGELVVAGCGLAFGRGAAAAVAASYAALAVAAWRLWRRAPATPCGCIGASDSPASGAHVVLNVIAAAAAALAAAAGSPLAAAGHNAFRGVLFVVLAGCAAALAATAIDSLPALSRAVNEGRAS